MIKVFIGGKSLGDLGAIKKKLRISFLIMIEKKNL